MRWYGEGKDAVVFVVEIATFSSLSSNRHTAKNNYLAFKLKLLPPSHTNKTSLDNFRFPRGSSRFPLHKIIEAC